jgi:hypothetical protein
MSDTTPELAGRRIFAHLALAGMASALLWLAAFVFGVLAARLLG